MDAGIGDERAGGEADEKAKRQAGDKCQNDDGCGSRRCYRA